MANSSPPWAAYCALMACCLVVLDKILGVRPVGIKDTLCRALDKLVMRSDGDQAETACGNLQLCAGLKDIIDGATHAVGQREIERVKARQNLEEEDGDSDEEEENVGVSACLNNLTIEAAVTEEEASKNVQEAL